MATIKEIKEELAELTDLADPRWAAFEADERIGVQAAVRQRRRLLQAELDEDKRLEKMLRFERELYTKGYHFIAGVDEVGRGPLAGPVVAAAVILPQNEKILGLNDSKQIPKAKHEAVYKAVCRQALAIGTGIIENQVIDRVNIYEATKLAMLAALEDLVQQPDYLLIDAMVLDTGVPQRSVIKGDSKSLSIAAASIVAKVTRDRIMADYDRQFPGYGFAHNAGYGTGEHLAGLAKLGVTPIHRRSFEPVKSM